MKIFSTTFIFSMLLCTAMALPAAHESSERMPTDSWQACIAQYAWPSGHNIMLDPNVRETSSGNNWTPLHVAVSHGYPKAAKMLLEIGAISVKDAKAQFPCELKAHEAAAARLLEHKSALAIVRTVYYYSTSCFDRFQWPDIDILETPNCFIRQDKIHTITPLHFAMFAGNFLLMQTLLKRGALPLKDALGRYPHEVPIQWKSTRQDYDKAKTLVRAVFQTMNFMHSLVREYNAEFISQAAQVDPAAINARDISKRTPLMYLVIGHECQIAHDDKALLATLKALLKHGAKTDCKDTFGKTAHDYYAASAKESPVREEILTLLA